MHKNGNGLMIVTAFLDTATYHIARRMSIFRNLKFGYQQHDVPYSLI